MHSFAWLKKTGISLLIAFILLTVSLAALGITVPKVKNLGIYQSHPIIHINGNLGFNASNGVTRGTGTASDPYVIEGWRIASLDAPAIVIWDTDACVVIKNISVEGTSDEPVNDGIVIHNASNVKMENLTVSGFRAGVFVEGLTLSPSTNIEMATCAVRTCTNGVVMQNSTNSLLNHSLLTGMMLDAIRLDNCSSVEVLDNEITNFGIINQYYYPGEKTWLPRYPTAGLSLRNANEVNVSGNFFSWGPEPFKRIEAERCSNLTISHNSFAQSDTAAIFVDGCRSVSVHNNTATGRFEGILVLHSDNCVIGDNSVADSYGSGIVVGSSSKMLLVRNSVLRSRGIEAYYTNDSKVEENDVENCTSNGLSAFGSNVTITSNLFISNAGGIELAGSNFTVEGNQIELSWGFGYGYPSGGLASQNADRLLIANNSISSSYNYGIDLHSCSNVSIEHNNISDNMELRGNNNLNVWGNSMHNVSIREYYSTGIVTWDEGYPEGGNYWSQYIGVDLKSGPSQNQPGSDGIGDIPYQVTGSYYDNYPLMNSTSAFDTYPPITVVSLTGTLGKRGWYTSDVNFTLSGFDVHSGIASTHYKLDSGQWQAYSSEVPIIADGVHSLEYYSIDGAGNQEGSRATTIKIDTESPQSSIRDNSVFRFSNTKTIPLRYEFTDNTSGLSYYGFGERYWSTSAVPIAEIVLSNGDHDYIIMASDEAGNERSVFISIHVSLNEDRRALSLSGPFGPWYLIAVLADLLLLGYLVHVRLLMSYSPSKPPAQKLEPGEKDKEEVVNGYPKYLKKM